LLVNGIDILAALSSSQTKLMSLSATQSQHASFIAILNAAVLLQAEEVTSIKALPEHQEMVSAQKSNGNLEICNLRRFVHVLIDVRF